MAIRDILKSLIPSLQDDGSKELAQSWMELIEDAGEIDALLSNPTFKKILEQMKTDFRERVSVLVNEDPELKAMRRMFIRTCGLQNAKARIEESVEELIDAGEIPRA